MAATSAFAAVAAGFSAEVLPRSCSGATPTRLLIADPADDEVPLLLLRRLVEEVVAGAGEAVVDVDAAEGGGGGCS